MIKFGGIRMQKEKKEIQAARTKRAGRAAEKRSYISCLAVEIRL